MSNPRQAAENGIITAVASLELHKRGNSAAEYEDAFAADAGRGRAAIADGASQSMHSALWARLLVDGFINAETPKPARWADWLPPLQESWNSQTQAGKLAWYAETKLQEGAFATFLGMMLEQPGWFGRRNWRAIAVGDACVFQVRDGRLRKAFPMTRAEDFDTSPMLVGSRSVPDGALIRKTQTAKGDWLPQDRFWLMTDAIAHWFLKECESGKKPWDRLEPFLSSSKEEFAEWIDNLRDREELRNDDVTMAVVRL